MSEPHQTIKMTTEELFGLLVYQANQFELFKDFVIQLLDLRGVAKIDEFHSLFKDFRDMNQSKPIQNLMTLKPKIKDIHIDLTLT